MRSYLFNEKQEKIQKIAKKVVEKEIKIRAEAVDWNGKRADEGMAILAEAGMIGCMIPKEYGGADLGYATQVLIIEEIAKECASTAWVAANTAGVMEAVLKHAEDEVKRELLTKLISGRTATVAVGGKIETTCVKQENTYLIIGIKRNVPNAEGASWFLVDADNEDGRKYFIVKSDPMLKVEKKVHLGMKGAGMANVYFENYSVPISQSLEGNVKKH